MNLASDEILIDLVDGGRIAGLTYLARDGRISNISEKLGGINAAVRANLEEIVALKPDLVIIAKFSHPDFIAQLKGAGIRTLLLEHFESIDGVRKTIAEIGKAVCEEERARELIERMDRELDEIAKTHSGVKNKPRVLYYSPAGFTAGKDSIVDDIITHAGGINAVSEAGIYGNKKVSLELIATLEPDVIVLSSYNPENPQFAIELLKTDVMSELKAVKTGRVYVVEDRYLIGASHYIVEGVRKLSGLIYGGAR
ncbi:MAG: ABC transporter substrate-binding protein [Candidatus Caldarchaeum sp.]